MLRLLLAFLATMTLGTLFVLAETIRQPLARLLRALILGLTGLLTVLGLAIGVTGLASETWWAMVVGAAILLVAGRLGWSLRRRRRIDPAPGPQHVPRTAPVHAPYWRSFETQLDWVGRQQLRRSRTLIERFVAERESPSLTPDHHMLLLSCEKRVPELIETCLERCRNASHRERDSYIDETLSRLNQIAAEAERARREVREADDRRLQVLHRYFDGVAGEGEQPRRLP